MNISPNLEGYKIENLRELMHSTWDRFLSTSEAVAAINKGEVDLTFYLIYLTETYHYTFHNSRNQSLVGSREDNRNLHYMQFCFEHAKEEVGHDQMAHHDLKSLGVKLEAHELPGPLPATEVLIAYLYRISLTGNPLRRLGYSFWAENSYTYIMPIFDRLKSLLNLERKNMTFIVQHSELDVGHAEEVEKQIDKLAVSDEDRHAIAEVMVTSLTLTLTMFDSIYHEYSRLQKNQRSKYSAVCQFSRD
jgi:pyrroloquinoline quinone (PQQ) biosynthesis protein C